MSAGPTRHHEAVQLRRPTMSRSTRSSLVAGLLLAILGGLLIDHGGHFGLQLIHLGEMGLAVGAVLGLVPDRAPAWRAGSFAVGFVAAWAGFAIRAGLMPDIPLGRAIATTIVLLVVTAATTASLGRLPLWAGLIGVAAFSGGYETTFSTNPTAFVQDSMTDATTIAFAVALGFFVATVVDSFSKYAVDHLPEHLHHHEAAVPASANGRPAQLATALPTQKDRDTAEQDAGISIVTTEADTK
jgi:hypothetical protein